ncbi:MAG TPA: MtrAB system histidine kinase MtrB [Streptosporangiaceae bacterium]|nr:MtrAB system histidine kinase MtrB [Streptosporangiaceae bacterium]
MTIPPIRVDQIQTGSPGPKDRKSWTDALSGRLSAMRVTRQGFTDRAAQLFNQAKTRWQGSLRLRVVSTTLVASAIVVSLLGFFLMQQITTNLLSKAEESAITQASDGLTFAQSQQAAVTYPDASSEQFMYNTVKSLKSSDEVPADQYGVAVGLPGLNPPVFTSSVSDNLPVEFLPPKLVKETYNNRKMKPVFAFARLPYPTADGRETAGLLYAAPFGSKYGLFYFFPLTQLQNELGVVLRTLALVGLALVFLLAGIAWLLTRWVVVPVARAAQGAQLLSTGKLEERLDVRGNDEVAALAQSFNEMAASLQDKMRELENLSQVQRQFVSDVSHELRTPLTTIRMAADLLFEAREQLSSQARRSAELLHGQLGRFEELLVDLLEISRYDANAATLDAELVDMCDIVRNSADVAQQLAERRGSRIEFRLPADPCVAEVDRRRVERILRNLLVNAVEHGEGREVVVSSAADRGAVAVVVRDHGVGLAPGEEILVFDRFWRADPARARTTGGTGLGLAIALEDARLHGGWLEAWGEPGQGSAFRLTLPRNAGGALAGSPLPLRPGPGDIDGLGGHRLAESPPGPRPAEPGALMQMGEHA